MNTHDKKEGMALTLLEAVETLSNIADFNFENVGTEQSPELGWQQQLKSVHRLPSQDANLTVTIVKKTFRVILNYLRNVYKKGYLYIKNDNALENIKTMMVLVGEAARKLDRYTFLFHKAQAKSITELKEYKKLQEFYQSHIARKIDERLLGKWILALSQKDNPTAKVILSANKSSQTKHVFVDLDSVKKDTEYELFFLRKEDGTRFFNPRLIRNLKLVNHFEDYIGEKQERDLLKDTVVWKDRFAHSCAKAIIKTVHRDLEKYYRETLNIKDHEVVEGLNKTIMALLLSANVHNLGHNNTQKNCRDYFYDFLFFLRKVLYLKDYQKFLAYPPRKSNKLDHCLLDTINLLCKAIYIQLIDAKEIFSYVAAIISQAHHQNSPKNSNQLTSPYVLYSSLNDDYKAVSQWLKGHMSGLLNKTLNVLEEGNYQGFDPLMQENLPTYMYSLYAREKKIIFMRWPCPTHQEYINKADVAKEFKSFLRACEHENNIKKCLIFNLQDRTSWKESYRCTALEDLPRHESYSKHIEVVTLTKDSEFYYQLPPYQDDNNADSFIKSFKEHLRDEHGGFLFSNQLKKSLFLEGFIDEMLEAVHRIFFSGKNILLEEHRKDFIEIAYLFLQLKIIDLVNPDVVGFTCKDGLDTSVEAGAEFFIFLKLLNQVRLSENDREHLDLMLYGPCLLLRERIMLPDRFHGLCGFVRAIESIRNQFGYQNFIKAIQENFAKFYKNPLLLGKIVFS